jgi:hypothetical protein
VSLCLFVAAFNRWTTPRAHAPQPEAQLIGWRLLAVACTCFPPGKLLYKYLLAYIRLNMPDSVVGLVASYCLEALKKVRAGSMRAECLSLSQRFVC